MARRPLPASGQDLLQCSESRGLGFLDLGGLGSRVLGLGFWVSGSRVLSFDYSEFASRFVGF